MNKIYKRIKLTWEYPKQPTSLQVGSVRIVRGTEPFTADTALSQTIIDYREYSPEFTSFEDTQDLEENVEYYYMIIIYGDTHPEILAATELHKVKIPLNPENVKPMVITHNLGGTVTITSDTPLDIDWGAPLDIEFRDTVESGQNVEILEDELGLGITMYRYYARTVSDSYYGNRISIKHQDGVSPLGFLSFQEFGGGSVIEQWYDGGYSRFTVDIKKIMQSPTIRQSILEEFGADFDIDANEDQVAHELLVSLGRTAGGFGYVYQVPDVPPPNTPNLDYMFLNSLVPQNVENWDVGNVKSMTGMFAGAGAAYNINLSNWCVSGITEEPKYFDVVTDNGLKEEVTGTITKPVWGTCPVSTVKPLDSKSMIMSLMQNTAYIHSETELEIVSADKFEITVEETTESDYSHLATYSYKITAADTRQVAAGRVAVRPKDGTGQIKGFGSEGFLKLEQWWSGGYDGFMRYLGMGTTIIPRTSPPNTQNYQYIVGQSNISSHELSYWDMSQAIDLSNMFYSRANTVYTDFSKWDVSNVENMSNMFLGPVYGGSMSDWNVSNVKYMNNMFNSNVLDFYNSTLEDTEPKYQDLTQWCVGNIKYPPSNFADERYLPKDKWPVWGTCPRGEKDFPPPEPIDPNEDEIDPNEIDAMVVRSTSMGSIYIYSQGKLTIESPGNTVNVNEMDAGAYIVYSVSPTGFGQGFTYLIRPVDSEIMPRLSINYIEAVEQWYPKGHDGFGLMGMAAFGDDILSVPTRAPRNTTDLSNMFLEAEEFNQDLSTWEVSKVTNMNNMFYGAVKFNADLSGWCVSNISKAPRDFLTGTLIEEDVSKHPVWGTCPSGILPPYTPPPIVPLDKTGAYVLSTPVEPYASLMVIGDAEVTFGNHIEEAQKMGPYPITDTVSYFGYQIIFDTNANFEDIAVAIRPKNSGDRLPTIIQEGFSVIEQWCPSGHEGFYSDILGDFFGVGGTVVKVPDTAPPNTPDFTALFYRSGDFNQDISNWDVSTVTKMDYMFTDASSFNQDLSSWCVSNIVSEPEGFVSEGTALEESNKPVWGTCPNK